MARMESTMMALGTTAPSFSLPDTVSGNQITTAGDGSAKATLIMFICNHCPYVKHVNPELSRIGKEYGNKGVRIIAISSNDVARYEEDGPEYMKAMAENMRFNFPYCYDESQEVAKAYDAVCTPDFFLFDRDLKLAYRGRLDNSTPGNGQPLTGADLRAALDALIAGTQPVDKQYPSVGCSIKWK